MRSTTYQHIAFRNIGDSQDPGQHYEGTVSECILWLAQKIAETSMATRFVFGMGRSKEDALKATNVPGAGRSQVTPSVQGMLDSVFGSTVADDYMPTPTAIPGDDYVA